MKKLISCVLCISWLTMSAIAATGVSPEFKMDFTGMGPWDVRTAAVMGCRSIVCCQYDEIRLSGGSLSADRIKADYDMIVNRNFLRYGPVENGKGKAE